MADQQMSAVPQIGLGAIYWPEKVASMSCQKKETQKWTQGGGSD
jgi:hypothetical protein